ncbi:MAG: hypothetical protein BGO67_09140 [Alphaproteobacteria bacterium 41-28]|nr:MAG: hypothetical protein BGO67_09140 [Alphaproteobacteria bacterium 41-28]
MNKIFRFIVSGFLNTVIGYSIIFGCMYIFKYSPELSNTLGYGIGTCTGYILHRNFSFGSDQKKVGEFTKFVFVNFISFLVNMIFLVVLIHAMNFNPIISQIISWVAYLLISYLLNNYFVFKKGLYTKILPSSK